MSRAKDKIHTFMAEVFHDVLRLESASLRQSGCRDLSVNEMHLLEAAALDEAGCGMGQLAARLSLSAGSVTTAVNALVRKGYLERAHCETDRRRVIVMLTPKAREALVQHQQFLDQLVDTVASQLDEAALASLGDALGVLHGFFRTM